MKKMESVLRKHWWKHSSEYVRISIWWNWIFWWRNRMLSVNLSLHMRRNWFKSHISRKKKRYHQMHLCFIVFIQSKTRLKIWKSCFYWMNMNVSFISTIDWFDMMQHSSSECIEFWIPFKLIDLQWWFHHCYHF